MGPIWMTLLLVSTLGFFSWSAFRRIRQVKIGVPDPRFAWTGEQIADRAKTLLVYAFGQKKMPNYTLAGFAHVGIFIAFQVLLLNSLMLWGRGFDRGFDFWGLLSTDHLIGKLYSFVKELAAFGAIAGSVVFLYLRWVKRGEDSGDPKAVKDKPRMTLGHHANRYIFTEPILFLFIIITMMAADFLYVGSSLVLDARAYGEPGQGIHVGWWEPFGGIFAHLLSGVDSTRLVTAFQHGGFWWHSAFVSDLPEHPAVLEALPRPDRHSERLRLRASSERASQGGGPRGQGRAGGVARNQPTHRPHVQAHHGPVHLHGVRALQRQLPGLHHRARSSHLSTSRWRFGIISTRPRTICSERTLSLQRRATSRWSRRSQAMAKSPFIRSLQPPEGGYFVGETVVDLVPNILHPDVIWGCTSCRACEEQCPVMISYVDKIIGMRREEVMIKNEFPGELQGAFNGIETNGNPWNISSMDRGDWADGLDIPTVERQARRGGSLLGRLRRELRRPRQEGRARGIEAAQEGRRRLRHSGNRRDLHRRPRAPRGQRVPLPDARRAERRDAQRLRGVQEDHHYGLSALLQHARKRVPRLRRHLRCGAPQRLPQRPAGSGQAHSFEQR